MLLLMQENAAGKRYQELQRGLMQRIVESWRVLPAGGLLCRVALCSLGRKVMTHNQFDQSDVIMLTININKSGFAIDTGL